MEYNITLNNLTTRFPEHLMQALVTLLEIEVLSHNIFNIKHNFLWVMLQV